MNDNEAKKMAGRRSTCPTLPVREAAGEDEQPKRGQNTTPLKCFGRRHSAPVLRITETRENYAAETTDRDPIPTVPSNEPPQLPPRRRVRPPVPTPRVTLLSVEERRQLVKGTMDVSGASDRTAAHFGSLAPWPSNDIHSGSMRPTAKPRKLKPLRPRRIEVVLPSAICSVPATGDHAHPLQSKSVRKDNVRSAPSVLPHFADYSSGRTRSDMAALRNHSHNVHSSRHQNHEAYENGNEKLMSPSNIKQLTYSRSQNKSDAEEKPEEASITNDASLMPRTKHSILLTVALVGVVIICVWTLYSSKQLITFHEARPQKQDIVGVEDLTVATDDNVLDSGSPLHSGPEITAQIDIDYLSANNSTEDGLEYTKFISMFSEEE
ncbi:hypothetical protein HPB51_007482 [Rhipicephalus microplus]|uniref:Uncharacterized protein n=1 Tax=Rhipicephalus microplus TaxID=6941 RepID=A0A9J6D4E1_RHIMP|nr:hypothetical protein HPB51_007482 [Rhipicephalus microplus]